MTYWESLRAYWRVYWPTQLTGLLLVFGYWMITSVTTEGGVPRASGLGFTVLAFAGGAALLFLFIPRLYSRPYRGFSLVAVDIATGHGSRRLVPGHRARVCLFLWWRQIAGMLFAWLLAMPLNMMLGIMGLQAYAMMIGYFTGILIVGPILVKMLIGHQFADFRMEARRDGRSMSR